MATRIVPLRITPRRSDRRGSGLDQEIWERLRWINSNGSPGFLERLVELFLEDCSQRLLRLRTCAEHGSFDDMLADASALKRGALELGAVRLARLAASLREAAAAAEPRRCTKLLAQVEAEFEFVRFSLTQS